MKNAAREDALTVGAIHQRNSGKNDSSYVWIIRIGSCRPWSSVDSVLKIIPLRQRGNAGPDSKGQCQNQATTPTVLRHFMVHMIMPREARTSYARLLNSDGLVNSIARATPCRSQHHREKPTARTRRGKGRPLQAGSRSASAHWQSHGVHRGPGEALRTPSSRREVAADPCCCRFNSAAS